MFIHNHQITLNKTILELPTNTLEPSKNPLLCTHQKLQKKTKYETISLEPLYKFITTPKFYTKQIFTFETQNLTHVNQHLKPNENITIKLIPTTKIFKQIRSKNIQNKKTLTTLTIFFTKNPIK